MTITPRMLRVGMVTGGTVLALWVAYVARGALFPFALGATVAFVISPLVERLARLQPWYAKRPETARGVAVLVVYVSASAAMVVAGFFFVPQLVEEVDQLIEDVPDLTRKARDQFSAWNAQYEERVPADLRARLDKSFKEIGADASAAAEAIAVRSLNVVVSTLATVLGFISVPFFVFYALKDRERAFARFYSWLPAHLQADAREIVRIGNHTLGAYIRAQLFLALVIFVITYGGLWLMGVEFALGLAFIAGLTEMIPIIGPLIGFVPAFIVVLATEPEHWWWVVLFYLGVQAVENYVLVPRIHASSVHMHPALVLMLLAVGGTLWGLWGVLVIVPLVAVVRDIFIYVYVRLGEAEERRRRRDVAGPG